MNWMRLLEAVGLAAFIGSQVNDTRAQKNGQALEEVQVLWQEIRLLRDELQKTRHREQLYVDYLVRARLAQRRGDGDIALADLQQVLVDEEDEGDEREDITPSEQPSHKEHVAPPDAENCAELSGSGSAQSAKGAKRMNQLAEALAARLAKTQSPS